MSRYPLNLPQELKKDAEQLAKGQGVSLNQFILWAVAEKVGSLQAGVDDPNFPGITYRRGASGIPTPVLSGTGLRVQTIIGAQRYWELSAEQIASEYGLTEAQVREALAFYQQHRAEIDVALAAEEALEPTHA